MNRETVQTFTTPAGEEMVILPRAEYERLADHTESAEDAARIETIRARMASGDEELIPSDLVDRLLSGTEHPLKVWREHRGLSQAKLADGTGVKQPTISEIERGRASGSVTTLRALARALGLKIEDLLPLED